MPKAILSVYDKTGLVDFARGLPTSNWTLLASVGRAKLLHENRIDVHRSGGLYKITRNLWSGRVKTLHPGCVHGGAAGRVPPKL